MKKQMTKILSTLILATIMSCSNGIEGKIIEQKVDPKDFGVSENFEPTGGKMDKYDLSKKYDEEILNQYDLNVALGCKPYLDFKNLEQTILVNTSTDKELRFTILKTVKTYDLKTDDSSCMEPNFDNPTITTDTDFEKLQPGDREILGTKKYYSKGKFIEIEYELTGAKEDK